MSISSIKTSKGIVLLVSSAFLIIIMVYLISAKYSIYDITPENYEIKLKEIDASIFEAGLDDVIPDKFSLTFSYDYLTSDNFGNNGVKIKNIKNSRGSRVEIGSSKTQINYWLTFRDKTLTHAFIFKEGFANPNSPFNPLVKKIIEDLVLKKGFLIKRTILINGRDIVIKETDNCFIIGKFYSGGDQVTPDFFEICAFSKKKYL